MHLSILQITIVCIVKIIDVKYTTLFVISMIKKKKTRNTILNSFKAIICEY